MTLMPHIVRTGGACLLTLVLVGPERPAAQQPAPAQGPASRPRPETSTPQPPPGQSPASPRRPETSAPQSYPPAQIQAGQRLFAAQCGFCHGRDAMGGESGPDLTRSALVAEDVRGDTLAPIIRAGRVDKGMPAFNLSSDDVAAVVAFVHDATSAAATLAGGRRSVDAGDLTTGSAEAGKRYFDGNCARCHSPARDLAGVATRFQGLALLQRMLYPSGGRGGGAPAPPKVTVTLASGETIAGTLSFRDEFTITVTDAAGWSRSWPANAIKFTIDDPLEAHVDQLGKYTDEDMHDVLAYLQTLRN
jgi:cytochrome c oxidase cbb3-type subunit 3